MQFKAQVVLSAFRGTLDPAAVLSIEADTPNEALDKVYCCTQNIDHSWINNPEVIEVLTFRQSAGEAAVKPDGLRSLSVGDHIILEDQGTWKVASFGFEKLDL